MELIQFITFEQIWVFIFDPEDSKCSFIIIDIVESLIVKSKLYYTS